MMRMVPASELAPYSVPCGPSSTSMRCDVVDMHVERAVDRRDRLLVEIDADARLRARMIAVPAADDAAHVDVEVPGAVAALARPLTVVRSARYLT